MLDSPDNIADQLTQSKAVNPGKHIDAQDAEATANNDIQEVSSKLLSHGRDTVPIGLGKKGNRRIQRTRVS